MTNSDGWIKLHRKIMDNPLYLAEAFTRMQAWIDLLLLANHKEGFFYVRGNKVVVSRGQVGTSSRTLASRWQWSRGKVERFLKELEYNNQIRPQKNNVITLISICNYDDFQNIEPQTEPQTSRRQTTDEPQTDRNKNDKNVNNDNNRDKDETAKRFVPPSINEVQSYISEKKYSVNAERFFNHYESVGWKVGRNKMKDWRASIRKWQQNERNQSTKPEETGIILQDNSQEKFKSKLW